MSALTTMFNFVVVYVRYFCCIVLGGYFSVSDFVSSEQKELAKDILFQLTGDSSFLQLQFPSSPLLILFVSVFVAGAVIGLLRRLIRG